MNEEVLFTKKDLEFAYGIANQIKEYCRNEKGVDLIKLGILLSYIGYMLNFASTSVVLNRMIKKEAKL